jgi:hypothetical protein
LLTLGIDDSLALKIKFAFLPFFIGRNFHFPGETYLTSIILKFRKTTKKCMRHKVRSYNIPRHPEIPIQNSSTQSGRFLSILQNGRMVDTLPFLSFRQRGFCRRERISVISDSFSFLPITYVLKETILRNFQLRYIFFIKQPPQPMAITRKT